MPLDPAIHPMHPEAVIELITVLLREVFPEREWLAPSVGVISLKMPHDFHVSIRYDRKPRGRIYTMDNTLLRTPLDITIWSDIVGFISCARDSYDKGVVVVNAYKQAERELSELQVQG